MILVRSTSAICSKLRQSDLKTSCSASFMYPRSFMSSEKTYLSASTLLSLILTLSGCLCAASCNFWTRVKMAQIWKVKPHLFGSMQYFSSMLIFFPLRFCHSDTGSSIHRASGIRCLSNYTIVDFPQPMFPSIVKWNLGSSGFITLIQASASVWIKFPAQNCMNQILNYPPNKALQRILIQIKKGGLYPSPPSLPFSYKFSNNTTGGLVFPTIPAFGECLDKVYDSMRKGRGISL